MREETLYVIASLLILAGLVLIVVGFQGTPLLWQAGLAVVAAAMLVSLATRWAKDDDEDR